MSESLALHHNTVGPAHNTNGKNLSEPGSVTREHERDGQTQPEAGPSRQHSSHASENDESDVRDRTGAERKSSRARGSRLMKRLKVPSPSMVLENTGSVARDHLANERTWLAYLRTSLAIASTGVALVQLFTLSASTSSDDNSENSPSGSNTSPNADSDDPLRSRIQQFARPLGGVIVALAIVVLGIGAHRYFLIQYALTKGRFPPARRSMALISGLLIAIVIVVFGVLVGVRT